jgi:alkylresorcinol/alkylpyrone synthase
MKRIGLRSDIERLPLVGLGCAGAILGLGRALGMARARPTARVLFLSVELCSVWFRRDDVTKTNVIASALFGDGAAGAILSCRGNGPRLGPAGEHTWPGSLDMVGWQAGESGLLPVLSRDIPAFIGRNLLPVVADFLLRNEMSLEDIGAVVCHPGGPKVLSALESAFGLSEGGLAEARSVLRDYGNMSAPTVLFVLQRMLENPVHGRMLALAFGPGLTVGFLVVDAG